MDAITGVCIFLGDHRRAGRDPIEAEALRAVDAGHAKDYRDGRPL